MRPRFATHHLLVNGQSRPCRVTGAGASAHITMVRPTYCPTKGCGMLVPQPNGEDASCKGCLAGFRLHAITHPVGAAS